MWKGFQRPQKVEIEAETLSPTFVRMVAQPLEPGFGTTIGNALRRCLLSSIEGAAITAIRIEGVLHEFSSVSGVVEDVTDIILNLKQVALRTPDSETRYVRLDAKGPGEVLAGSFSGDPNVQVADGDAKVATLNEEGHLKLEARVAWGRGYVPAEKNFDETMGIGWIPIDALHSPVSRVNFKVENARVGRATDSEKLILEVWTNGTVAPEDAVSMASELLRDHLTIFLGGRQVLEATVRPTGTEGTNTLDGLLDRSVDDLDGVSVRSINCLKNANIHTLRDLVSRSPREMEEIKNFGKKSLEEVEQVLGTLGLHFGMEVGGSTTAG
jgi:DNA-directed RNA polymerase subunit alpha